MKVTLSLLFICFSFFFAEAQNVKAYMAVVKTNEGKQTGVLSFVDSNLLILKSNNNYIYVHYSEIKSIKLRQKKQGYQAKDIVPYGTNWMEDPYKTLPNGQLVLKPGKEAPSLGESIAAPFVDLFMTSFVNALANSVLAPVHAINPSVAKFKNTSQNPLTKDRILELKHYSTNYQINPDYIGEAKQLAEIGKDFKP